VIVAAPIPLTWTLPSDNYPTRLGLVLESWKGTPYMIGQQQPGQGVDCIRFVTAVLDEMSRFPAEKLDRLPGDASLNQPEIARAFMRSLIERYHLTDLSQSGVTRVEPGDILAVGAAAGGPGHAIIVGPARNTTWQAGTHAVIRSGWTLQGRWQTLKHWFRPNREGWND
jgi:cell wall-associated NlpC family hydrolase